jgi:hypothetical protein
MKDTLLKSLLKAKTNQNDEIEVLIEKYLASVVKTNKKQSKAFVSDLLVYIMNNAENLEKDILLQVVESKLSHLGYSVETAALETMHTKAAAAVASSVGASFSFDKTDAEVLDSMYRALTWMKEDGAANTSNTLKSIIADAMQGEVNLADLGETLRGAFEGVVDESARYFEGVSDHVIRQSQSVTRAYQYEKAGVTEVKVVAVIDSRTSLICRSMHGRIIPLAAATSQADAITAAKSIEEKKKASRWQSQPIFGTLPKDVALPPYHFRCRTIVVAYFPQSAKIDGKNVNGSLLPGENYKGDKKVLFSHRDRFGYERVITDKTIEHGGNYHDVSLKDMRAGLNSLESVAMHGEFEKRTLGYSRDKNLLFSFEDGEVMTVFRPDDGEDNFKKKALMGTIESKSVKKGEYDEKL